MNNLPSKDNLSARRNSGALTDLARARDLKKREKTLETQPCETDSKFSIDDARTRLNQFILHTEVYKINTRIETHQSNAMHNSIQADSLKVTTFID